MTGSTADDRAHVIECRGLGKKFAETWILQDVDLRVDAGSIVGLIGPSGSGKTTMVRLMNGVYRPDAGTVEVLGVAPSERRTAERTEIGYLPQDPVLFDELSLWENLNFHASLNGVPFRRSRRLRQILDLVDLDDDRKKLVSESSGGMKRRLGLAATLVHDPRILMLDEPTAGIDPILRTRFWEHFREIATAGKTLVISTQFVEEAALCDVVAVIADGRICAIGTPAQLRMRALGGHVFDLVYDRDVVGSDLRVNDSVDTITDAAIVDPRRIRIVVDPSAGEVDDVVAELQGQRTDATSVREVPVDWNEIFVELVGQRPGAAQAGDGSESDSNGTPHRHVGEDDRDEVAP